jgi:hypothetical protein
MQFMFGFRHNFTQATENAMHNVSPSYSTKQGGIGFLFACMFAHLQCRLSGCVPVPAQTEVLLTGLNYAETLITGKCPTQRLEVEQQQREALELLPEVFYTDTEMNSSSWRAYMKQTLQTFPTLSGFYGEGKIGSAPKFTFTDPGQKEKLSIDVQFESINGAFCIIEILSYPLGVNTTALLELLPRLPYLKSFRASWVSRYAGRDKLREQPMPVKLADVAPRSLEVLELRRLDLCCQLPEEWGSWSTIEQLVIAVNERVTGPLPDWQGMKSLKLLDLSSNNLTGTLPASYGSPTWSKNVQILNLNGNEQLTGTIPGTWAGMSAAIDLQMTGITGCVPDQLINTVKMPLYADVVRCSVNNTELLALKALKGLLDKGNRMLPSWKEDPGDYAPGPLEGNVCCLLMYNVLHVKQYVDRKPRCMRIHAAHHLMTSLVLLSFEILRLLNAVIRHDRMQELCLRLFH